MEKNLKKVCLEDVNEYWFKKNISEKEGKLYLIFKTVIDAVFGCIGFLLFIFLYPFLAILIKSESAGRVLFKQQRVGKNGNIIEIYKFRTMYESGDNDGEKWREKNKNNITRLGRILRASHLDEIPQSMNILKGELSFIGPRAEWVDLAKIFEKEIPFYKNRYSVKPGLMGWAQINFRASQSLEEAKEKFEYDLYYIKNRSVLLDLEIILKSFKLFFM